MRMVDRELNGYLIRYGQTPATIDVALVGICFFWVMGGSTQTRINPVHHLPSASWHTSGA